MKSNIILEGFMGSGKTTVGIRLSYKLFMTVVDTDKLIEKEQGMSVSEIFAKKGEDAFRELETGCLQKLLEEGNKQIISLGGGTPVKKENRELLKKLGIVVYLRVKPQTVYDRIKNDSSRPLLQCENPLQRICDMMFERKEAYETTADITIDTDGLSFDEITNQIRDAVEQYEKDGKAE